MQKNKKITLSIIIPVYNVKRYLNECLNSVFNYKGDNIEIIVVNDGSTDDSLSVLLEYEKNNDCMTVINQNNQGLSVARNKGIKFAKGEYLLFLDSDDFIKTDSLTHILSDIDSDNGKDFYLGRAFKYVDKENVTLCQVDYEKIHYYSPCKFLLDLHKIPEFWFAAWLLVINRDFLINNNLYFKSGIYHEDELWVPSVFVKAKSMGFLNYGFYCYRVEREGSIVATPKVKREFDKLIVVDELDKLKGNEKYSNLLIKDRQASIVFGIILSLSYFEGNIAYEELIKELNGHVCMLKYEKYTVIYLLVKLFGVRVVSKILKLIFK